MTDMDNLIKKTMDNLRLNNIEPFYADNKAIVCKIVDEMLFDGCSITAGGSESVRQSGVYDIINSGKYNFYNRLKPGLSEEERLETFRMAIGCDFFLCSSNAVTVKGELINVDGNANRISSICFGPKNVIMIVGINKIVNNVDDGIMRVKKIAAPLNTKRLSVETPCKKLGHCISLEKSSCPQMTDGCATDSRICCNYLISAHQRIKNRIKVIICNENLGY